MPAVRVADLCRNICTDEIREINKELIVECLEYKTENSRKGVCIFVCVCVWFYIGRVIYKIMI